MSLNSGNWDENSQYVIRELERLNTNIERVLTEVHTVRTELEIIKYKHSIWGALGGVLSWMAITFFEKQFK